jgi:glucokinase
MTMILAGDVGGTHARFALMDVAGRRVIHQEVLLSSGFATFEAALGRFLAGAEAKGHLRGAIQAASFGIAGPVVDQRVKTTNLPWQIDAAAVGKKLGLRRVSLLNDLVALGLGALQTGPSKLRIINVGRPKKRGGNVAVIAAGTGLGEAAFVWDGSAHVPCPTEGSHVDFAPRTAVEAELWAKLTRTYGHVSYERVASGSTIHVLYTFFVEDQGVPESKASAQRVASAPDKNVAVVELAEGGKSEAAMRAIELWSSVYGAEAGNLALKCLATAGVFVCGGASARLAEILVGGLPARRGRKRGKRGEGTAASPFLEAFLDKGRMRSLLERVPVAVCTEPLAGLLGAAAHAASEAAGSRAPAAKAAPAGRARRPKANPAQAL